MWNKRPGWGVGWRERAVRSSERKATLSYVSVIKYSRTCGCIVLITKKLFVSSFVQLKSSHSFGLPHFHFPEPPTPKRNSSLLAAHFRYTRPALRVTVSVRTVALETLYCNVYGSHQRSTQFFVMI